MDKGFIFLLSAMALMAVFLIIFERRKISAKEITVLAVLAALAGLGRIPFAAVPSVQPTTFLVILSGYVFGCSAGFLVGLAAAVVSNIFLGQGPWTVMQMLAWGLCGLSAGILGKVNPQAGRGLLTGFGFVWGFLFGWLMNLWYWLAFVYPLTFGSWLLTNTASAGFDLIHAVGNAAFLLILGPEFVKILSRFKQKLSYSY